MSAYIFQANKAAWSLFTALQSQVSMSVGSLYWYWQYTKNLEYLYAWWWQWWVLQLQEVCCTEMVERFSRFFKCVTEWKNKSTRLHAEISRRLKVRVNQMREEVSWRLFRLWLNICNIKKRSKRLMIPAEIFKSKSNEEEFCNTSMMSAGAEISSREKVVKNDFAYFNLFL